MVAGDIPVGPGIYLVHVRVGCKIRYCAARVSAPPAAEFEIRPWKSLVARVRLFWGSLSDRGYKRGSFIGLARGRPGGVVMSHDRQNLRPAAMQGSSNSEFHPSDLSFTKRMKHLDNSGFRRRGW